METIELTAGQARDFERGRGLHGFAAAKKLKAMAKAKAFKLKVPVALSHKGRTLYIAHPNGRTECGGCGTCKRCIASQGRAEERAVD